MLSEKIILRVTNTSTFLEGKLYKEIYAKLKKTLGYLPEEAIFLVKNNIKNNPNDKWKHKWDGRISCVCYNRQFCRCYIKKDGTHFPTGLLSKARELFQQENVPFIIVDERGAKPTPTLNLSLSPMCEERDYQEKVVNDSCNIGRGLIKMATGSGKSSVIAKIITKLKISPFVFYVTSIDLLKQAQLEFSRFILDNGEPLKVGIIGDGACDIRDINVMTIQTAVRACGHKYVAYDDEEEGNDNKELNEKRADILKLVMSAQGVGFDECQHVKSEIAQVVSDYSISARYRWGLSATIHRDSGDDILIDACFGKTIADISASFLIAHPKHYLVKPDIYFVPVNNMYGVKEYTYHDMYKRAIIENVQRNEYIAKLATSMADKGHVILILCRQIDHGEMLNNLIPGSVFLHGVHSGKVRKEHLDKMRRREAGITIASTILDEGIDVRPLDTLILSGSGKCLEKSTRIFTSYGLLSLDNIFNNFVKKDKNKNGFYNFDHEYNNHFYIDTMMGHKNPDLFYNGNLQKCIKITMDNGLYIEGTLSHRIRVLRNGKIKFVLLKNIRIDDRIVVKKGSNLFGDNVELPSFKAQHNKKLCFPEKMDEDFSELIGYVLSEGDLSNPRSIRISNIYNGDDKDIRKFTTVFGVTPHKLYEQIKHGPEGEKNGWRYDVNSKDIKQFFNILGITGYSKQRIIPDIIVRSSKKVICSFLRAFFEAESHVDNKCIDLVISSKKMLEDIQLLLLNIGIMSYVKNKKTSIYGKRYKAYRLVIYNQKNLQLFENNIGFKSTKKRQALKRLLKREYNPNKNVIPGIKNICKIVRNQSNKSHCVKDFNGNMNCLTKLCSSSNSEFTHKSLSQFLSFYNDVKSWHVKYLRFLLDDRYEYIKIKKIVNSGMKNVYDLNICTSHYVAHGTISHNSATRALQRVGRILRPYPGKEKATVIDFWDNCKWMLAHSKKRKKMYQTEPEFNIETLEL